MSESYDEVIAVWKKVTDEATSCYTCNMSRKTVLKRLNDLYEMLKRAEDPKSARSHREKWHLCVDKLFDISKNDIKDHRCEEDFEFIQDQKGSRQATVGGKDMKLDKRIKGRLYREESTQKRPKASESERELLSKVVESSSQYVSSASSESSL